MIAAISLMRRRDDVSLTAFRRHWLDVHGPLVCAFPALRRYVQDHVIGSAAMNERARQMRIDGFPILSFDNDQDRLSAHHSPEMAACNVDSREFIGAVARVICEPRTLLPQATDAGHVKLIALLPGKQRDDAALHRFADRVSRLPRLCGLMLYDVLEQGPAPNSTIPHLPVAVTGLAELAFLSLVDLECVLTDLDTEAAHFVVEEHRLV